MACFSEKIVKKSITLEDRMFALLQIVASIVIVMVVSLVPSLAMYWLFIVALVIFANYYLFKRMNIEYEYTYIDGDLTIDKIINKSARKRLIGTSMDSVEQFGKLESMDENMKIVDYTSHTGNKDAVYFLVISNESNKKAITFEPNEQMIEDMQARFSYKFLF